MTTTKFSKNVAAKYNQFGNKAKSTLRKTKTL